MHLHPPNELWGRILCLENGAGTCGCGLRNATTMHTFAPVHTIAQFYPFNFGGKAGFRKRTLEEGNIRAEDVAEDTNGFAWIQKGCGPLERQSIKRPRTVWQHAEELTFASSRSVFSLSLLSFSSLAANSCSARNRASSGKQEVQ